MIQAGLKSGALTPGKTIIDATSGNTGIAYAMIGAALGYPVKLALPDSASHERKRILAAFGAELVMTPGDEATDGAIRKVHEIVAADPQKYFYPDQYSNPANWQAHYHGTANEIWNQTEGRITHFVAGLGTSGTFVGTTRRLRELNPKIRCISLQPDGPFHGLEGWKHMETALVPSIYDATLADENLEVSTEESYQFGKASRARRRFACQSERRRSALWLLQSCEIDSPRSARRHRYGFCRFRVKISQRTLLGRTRLMSQFSTSEVK